MNRITQMLRRFTNDDTMQDFARKIRAMQRPPRSATYKPAASYGFRGAPRTLTPLGSTPAPTIDQVRNLERAYLCKIHVRQGIMYFRNEDIPFTHEEAEARRTAKLQTMLDECA